MPIRSEIRDPLIRIGKKNGLTQRKQREQRFSRAVSANPEVRAWCSERRHGASVDEARDFCRGGLPQAIVIEAALRGDRFNELRKEVRTSGTDVAFIEIIEEGSTFEVSGFGGLNTARVGRDAIATSLAPALTFELAKVA